jgi:hypothetical protein
VAVTKNRLLAYRYGTCLMNVPFDDGRFKEVDFSAETAGVITFAFEAGLFQPNCSGEIEICYRTPHAVKICSELSAHARAGRVVPSRRAPSR